jgi:hypothetical protein
LGLVFGVINNDERKMGGYPTSFERSGGHVDLHGSRTKKSDAVQSALSRRLELEQYPIHLRLSEMYVFGLVYCALDALRILARGM